METLQQWLQALIDCAMESWTYAIFWRSSVDVADSSLLVWGDGYFKGDKKLQRRHMAVASAAGREHRKHIRQELNPLISSTSADQECRKGILRKLSFLVSGASTSNIDVDAIVTDSEWFFIVSMSQQFTMGRFATGLPGQSFFSASPLWVTGADQLAAASCKRARQAQVFGFQTMVCIPLGNGVVEVGSTNLITKNPELKKSQVLLNFDAGRSTDQAKKDPSSALSIREHYSDLQQRKRVVVRKKIKEERKVDELPSTTAVTGFQTKEVGVESEKEEEKKKLEEKFPPTSGIEEREKLDEFPPTSGIEEREKLDEFPPITGFEGIKKLEEKIQGLEEGKKLKENTNQEATTSHEEEDKASTTQLEIFPQERKDGILLLTYNTNQDDTQIMISNFEKSIENDVRERMEKTLREESLVTIPKIPAGIRQGMNDYYEPRIISIGPYHKGKPELQYMEKRKWLYLDALLSRNKNRSLKEYVDIIVEFEDRVRNCYQRNDELESEDFVKMMLVDGCFIVEYLMQLVGDNLTQVKLHEMVWMQSVVHNDMFLLENQLPFDLLLRIFNFATENQYPISFVNLAHKFFRRVSPTEVTEAPPLISTSQVHHLLHLYHISLFPTPTDVNDGNPPANLLARVKSKCIHLISCQPSTLEENPSLAHAAFDVNALEAGPFLTKMIPSAKALEEAGIKFKKKDRGSILDAKFCKGVLEIPPLLVDAFTMSRFRNLIALEKLFPSVFKEPYFTAYLQFLDYMVNTSKDIELLQKAGIITHALGSDDEVARLFNGLSSGTFDYQPYYLKKLYEEIDTYCKAKRHIWRAILLRDYFSNPWAAFSVVAAVILLIFAFLQAFFSMYAYFRPPSGSS